MKNKTNHALFYHEKKLPAKKHFGIMFNDTFHEHYQYKDLILCLVWKKRLIKWKTQLNLMFM